MCTSKILTDLFLTKEKAKIKNSFGISCLQYFSSQNVLNSHKEVCLSINDTQSVRLKKQQLNLKISLSKY